MKKLFKNLTKVSLCGIFIMVENILSKTGVVMSTAHKKNFKLVITFSVFIFLGIATPGYCLFDGGFYAPESLPPSKLDLDSKNLSLGQDLFDDASIFQADLNSLQLEIKGAIDIATDFLDNFNLEETQNFFNNNNFDFSSSIDVYQEKLDNLSIQLQYIIETVDSSFVAEIGGLIVEARETLKDIREDLALFETQLESLEVMINDSSKSEIQGQDVEPVETTEAEEPEVTTEEYSDNVKDQEIQIQEESSVNENPYIMQVEAMIRDMMDDKNISDLDFNCIQDLVLADKLMRALRGFERNFERSLQAFLMMGGEENISLVQKALTFVRDSIDVIETKVQEIESLDESDESVKEQQDTTEIIGQGEHEPEKDEVAEDLSKSDKGITVNDVRAIRRNFIIRVGEFYSDQEEKDEVIETLEKINLEDLSYEQLEKLYDYLFRKLKEYASIREFSAPDINWNLVLRKLESFLADDLAPDTRAETPDSPLDDTGREKKDVDVTRVPQDSLDGDYSIGGDPNKDLSYNSRPSLNSNYSRTGWNFFAPELRVEGAKEQESQVQLSVAGSNEKTIDNIELEVEDVKVDKAENQAIRNMPASSVLAEEFRGLQDKDKKTIFASFLTGKNFGIPDAFAFSTGLEAIDQSNIIHGAFMLSQINLNLGNYKGNNPLLVIAKMFSQESQTEISVALRNLKEFKNFIKNNPDISIDKNTRDNIVKFINSNLDIEETINVTVNGLRSLKIDIKNVYDIARTLFDEFNKYSSSKIDEDVIARINAKWNVKGKNIN